MGTEQSALEGKSAVTHVASFLERTRKVLWWLYPFHTWLYEILQTTEIYSFIVLKTRLPKSRWQQGCTPSQRLWRRTNPCLLQLLVALDVPWVVTISPPSLPPCAPGLSLLPVSPLSVLKRTLVLVFRAHTDNPKWSHLVILNDICQVPLSKWSPVVEGKMSFPFTLLNSQLGPLAYEQRQSHERKACVFICFKFYVTWKPLRKWRPKATVQPESLYTRFDEERRIMANPDRAEGPQSGKLGET